MKKQISMVVGKIYLWIIFRKEKTGTKYRIMITSGPREGHWGP